MKKIAADLVYCARRNGNGVPATDCPRLRADPHPTFTFEDIEPPHELMGCGGSGPVTRNFAEKKGRGVCVGLGEAKKRRGAGGFGVAGAQRFLDSPEVNDGFRR